MAPSYSSLNGCGRQLVVRGSPKSTTDFPSVAVVEISDAIGRCGPLPLRTVGLLGVPIQHKGLQGIALSGLILPALGSKGRTHHVDLILPLRGHE